MSWKILTCGLSLAMLIAASDDNTIVAPSAGDTRLADAAQRGDRPAVRALLKGGANVNSAQGDGMTALHWAPYRNDPEMAESLIQAGANVKAGTRLQGLTPLFIAAK